MAPCYVPAPAPTLRTLPAPPDAPLYVYPCGTVTMFLVCAPCVQIHQGSTSFRVMRLFGAALQRARRGRAAGGSSSSVVERKKRLKLGLVELHPRAAAAAHAGLVALLVDADDESGRAAAHGGRPQYRARGWDGCS